MQGGGKHRFDTVYTALGVRVRSGLATALGAEADEDGALIVRDHQRTSVPGLYAAGDVVRGLSQVSVAIGQAAVAATDINASLPFPRPPGLIRLAQSRVTAHRVTLVSHWNDGVGCRIGYDAGP